jgi:hypothetical protein
MAEGKKKLLHISLWLFLDIKRTDFHKSKTAFNDEVTFLLLEAADKSENVGEQQCY